MRKVEILEWEYPILESGRSGPAVLKHKGKTGLFRQFGVNYEEFETGPGNYTTAVVELPDGNIENIPVEQIKFVS